MDRSRRLLENASKSHLAHDLSIPVILSYVFDWILLIVLVIAAVFFGRVAPNKRPFSLADPNIQFPFTEHEACPGWLLLVLIIPVPAVLIAFTSLVLTPGFTVPSGTPAVVRWKRKLWELHAGWLGLALSIVAAYFLTNGLKNMIGKPRPDLLARCEPDYANAAQYRIGGFAAETGPSVLFSATICRQTDKSLLDDGFRSYPSGHSSTAAASLVYLSLYLASKLAVPMPFAGWWSLSSSSSSANDGPAAHTAFPSRLGHPGRGSPHDKHSQYSDGIDSEPRSSRGKSQPPRRQAAAAPIYLLFFVLVPFCASLWIASSRWYDFRHHGFDILFGWFMGFVIAVFSFRSYHLPVHSGAGWAWGPRSRDRAFWAGVGRLGYAGANDGSLMEGKAVDGRLQGEQGDNMVYRENAGQNMREV